LYLDSSIVILSVPFFLTSHFLFSGLFFTVYYSSGPCPEGRLFCFTGSIKDRLYLVQWIYGYSVCKCANAVYGPSFDLQPLPYMYVPKLFQPSVGCPECRYANVEGFKFCQNCAFKRQSFDAPGLVTKKLKYTVDEKSIAPLPGRVNREEKRDTLRQAEISIGRGIEMFSGETFSPQKH